MCFYVYFYNEHYLLPLQTLGFSHPFPQMLIKLMLHSERHDVNYVDRSFPYVVCINWTVIAHRCLRLIANTTVLTCRCAVEFEFKTWNGREHGSWRHGGGWWSSGCFVSARSHRPRCDRGLGPETGRCRRSVPVPRSELSSNVGTCCDSSLSDIWQWGIVCDICWSGWPFSCSCLLLVRRAGLRISACSSHCPSVSVPCLQVSVKPNRAIAGSGRSEPVSTSPLKWV